MRKAFFVVWVLGWVFFAVGVAGLIWNTASHTVFPITGLLVSFAGYLLFGLSPRRK